VGANLSGRWFELKAEFSMTLRSTEGKLLTLIPDWLIRVAIEHVIREMRVKPGLEAKLASLAWAKS
jgi:hypothetical protein